MPSSKLTMLSVIFRIRYLSSKIVSLTLWELISILHLIFSEVLGFSGWPMSMMIKEIQSVLLFFYLASTIFAPLLYWCMGSYMILFTLTSLVWIRCFIGFLEVKSVAGLWETSKYYLDNLKTRNFTSAFKWSVLMRFSMFIFWGETDDIGLRVFGCGFSWKRTSLAE